jgi:hypothetical protein
LGLIGGTGLAYKNFVPETDPPEKILPPSRLRIAMPRKRRESLRKLSAAKEAADLDWKAKLLLGASAPIGLYGAYELYKRTMEDVGARRLQNKIRRLQGLTDPVLLAKEEDEEEEEFRAQNPEFFGTKTASVEEQLGEEILDQLAENVLEKTAFKWPWSGSDEPKQGQGVLTKLTPAEVGSSAAQQIWKDYWTLLGGAMGTGGLVAYLASRRQLLPESHLKARTEIEAPQLMYDRMRDEEEEEDRRQGGWGLGY